MGISQQQALDCFTSAALIGIGMEADAIRRSLHPEGVVTYSLEQQIDASGDIAAITRHVDQAVELGASGVTLDGDRSLSDWESLLHHLRSRFPELCLRGLSPSWIPTLDVQEGLEPRETLSRLREAGLDSLGIEEATLIHEGLSVHRVAHSLGMTTTASLTFGAGETMEQRVEQLAAVRALQSETGGFHAFVLLTYNATGHGWDEMTAVESLKTMAICRMFLDNIENVQATGPLKVLQMGLRFGANDVGSAVLGAKGTNVATEEELRRIIRDAGFQPVQRDPLYRVMMLT